MLIERIGAAVQRHNLPCAVCEECKNSTIKKKNMSIRKVGWKDLRDKQRVLSSIHSIIQRKHRKLKKIKLKSANCKSPLRYKCIHRYASK